LTWWATVLFGRSSATASSLAGYEPSRSEAEQALNALSALEEFAKMRVAEKRKQSPKTALIVLGPDELDRRGGWDRRIREFAEQNQENTWLADYNAWRAQVSAASA
jgi:hypothetical protein